MFCAVWRYLFVATLILTALLSGEIMQRYKESPAEAMVDICDGLHVGPELFTEAQWEDVFSECMGPVLCCLKNGNWVCVLKAEEAIAEKEQIAIFDPLSEGQSKIIQVKLEQFKLNWGGQAIRFNNLFIKDDGTNTALFCLASVGKHHGVDIDMRRLLHEYAVEEDEIEEKLFYKIVSDYKNEV